MRQVKTVHKVGLQNKLIANEYYKLFEIANYQVLTSKNRTNKIEITLAFS